MLLLACDAISQIVQAAGNWRRAGARGRYPMLYFIIVISATAVPIDTIIDLALSRSLSLTLFLSPRSLSLSLSHSLSHSLSLSHLGKIAIALTKSGKQRWETKEVVQFYYNEVKPLDWSDFVQKISGDQEDLLYLLGLKFKEIIQCHYEIIRDLETELVKKMSYMGTLAHQYGTKHQEIIADPLLGPELDRLSDWLLLSVEIQGIIFVYFMQCISTLYERRPTHRIHKKRMLLLFSGQL